MTRWFNSTSIYLWNVNCFFNRINTTQCLLLYLSCLRLRSCSYWFFRSYQLETNYFCRRLVKIEFIRHKRMKICLLHSFVFFSRFSCLVILYRNNFHMMTMSPQSLLILHQAIITLKFPIHQLNILLLIDSAAWKRTRLNCINMNLQLGIF